MRERGADAAPPPAQMRGTVLIIVENLPVPL